MLSKNKWGNTAQYLTNKILATKGGGGESPLNKCKIPPKKKKKPGKGTDGNVTGKVVTTRGEGREMVCGDMQWGFKE